jgi:S1-C subfamily serine protease
VRPESPAAKAGLKAHDVLVEIDGKAVPDNVREFAQMVGQLKAKTPVDAVVIRKGKQETVKGLSLPEANELRFPTPPGAPAGPRFGAPNIQGD